MKNFTHYLFSVFILIIIGGTLLNLSIFYYPSQTAYFSYALLSSLFLIGVLTIQIFNPSPLRISWPFVLLSFWFIYTAIQVIITQSVNFSFYYPLVNLSLLFAIYLLAQQKQFNNMVMFKGILLIAILQALICVLQYLSIIDSKSVYFKVTGSWENPNVTAMFLTMTIPMVYDLWLKRKQKKILIALALIITAIILLGCRSAFLGVGVILVLILCRKYNVLLIIKNKVYRGYNILGFFLLACFCIPFAKQLYQSKKASADGRLIIWKVSAAMVTNAPLTGVGYGLFEKQYNLKQASFISQNKLNAQEKSLAGAAKMAYNDYLQNVVEGGLIGFLLFSASILLLLFINIPVKSGVTKEANINDEDCSNYLFTCKMGLAAFAVMALVNFVVEAIPVMCLFTFYAAIISAKTSSTIYSLKPNKPFYLKLSFILLLIFSGFLFIKMLLFSYANFKNRQAKDFLTNQQPKEALTILKLLEPQLSNLESYHSNYAAASFALEHYQDAINHLNKAKLVSSSPHLYSLSATIYQIMGQHQLAKQELQMLGLLNPGLLTPKYRLMKYTLQIQDISTAVASAQEILQLKPKVSSKKATFIKLEAQKLLLKLGVKSNPYKAIKVKRLVVTPAFNINQPKF